MRIRIRFGCYVIAAVAALLSAGPARASVVVAVQFVSAVAGSTGNGLDVTLMNTGPSDLTIGGFNFEITTLNTDITFTGTNISTSAAYVLAGDSAFGPNINAIFSAGQNMDGSDFSNLGLGDLVAAGSTVGLGHVLFDILPNATTGSFAVSLVTTSAGTSLTDALGNPIPIDAFTAGQITVTGTAAVPEPGSLATLGCGIAVLLAARKRRRKT